MQQSFVFSKKIPSLNVLGLFSEFEFFYLVGLHIKAQAN